jgi:hypothetical protein
VALARRDEPLGRKRFWGRRIGRVACLDAVTNMADYLEYVRDPANGYGTVAFPIAGGMELSRQEGCRRGLPAPRQGANGGRPPRKQGSASRNSQARQPVRDIVNEPF